MSEMKKRWIALYVENDVGVLAKVSGLFSGKSYNLQSLTVGTTEDETVSRMTISVESDDITFEQIKKQLNRMVEVIKVIDLTNVPLRLKELMFVKIMELNETQMTEVFQIAQAMRVDVVDIGIGSVMLECRRTEQKHDDLIAILKKKFKHISAEVRLLSNQSAQSADKNAARGGLWPLRTAFLNERNDKINGQLLRQSLRHTSYAYRDRCTIYPSVWNR